MRNRGPATHDGRSDKPTRVADRIEESQSFLHSVDAFVFVKLLIILRYGDEEDDSGDVFEAMYPLFPLRPLTSDVEELVSELSGYVKRKKNGSNQMIFLAC